MRLDGIIEYQYSANLIQTSQIITSATSELDGDNMTATLETLVQEIYKDSRVSPGEIIKLRKLAEEAEKAVLEKVGYQGTTAALFKSFDVTYQLLQETLLQARKQNLSEENKKAILLAVQANIQLLKTTVDAFSQ